MQFILISRADFIGERELFRPSDGKPFRWWFSFVTSRLGKYVIVLFWLACLIVSLFWAPRFVLHTHLQTSSPEGTKGARAHRHFRHRFGRRTGAKWLVVRCHCSEEACANYTDIDDESLPLRNITHEFKQAVIQYNDTHGGIFYQFKDYYTQRRTCHRYAASASEEDECYSNARQVYVGGKDSHTRDTAIMLVSHRKHVTDKRRKKLVHWVNQKLDKIYHHYREQISLKFAGQIAFQRDAQVKSKQSILRHVYSLPLILLIFCFGTASWRTLPIPMINSVLCIAVSMCLMYPVSVYIVRFNVLTPDIMAVICVALTIDYDLFFLSIFYEELGLDYSPGVLHIRTLFSVLRKTMLRTGKIIFISGAILTLSVLCYLASDFSFLISYAIGCAVAVACAIAINMSMTPALILIIPGFFCEMGFDCQCTRVIYDDTLDPMLGRVGGGGDDALRHRDSYLSNGPDSPRKMAQAFNSATGSEFGSAYLYAGGGVSEITAPNAAADTTTPGRQRHAASETASTEEPTDDTPLLAAASKRKKSTEDTTEMKGDIPDESTADKSTTIQKSGESHQRYPSTDSAEAIPKRKLLRKKSSHGSGSKFTSFGGYNSEESSSSEDFTGLAVPSTLLASITDESDSGSRQLRTPSPLLRAMETETAGADGLGLSGAHSMAELSSMDAETRARLRGRRLEYHPFPRGEENKTQSVCNKCFYKVGVVSTLFPCTLLLILVIVAFLLWGVVLFAELNVTYNQNLVLPRDSEHVKVNRELKREFYQGVTTPWLILIPKPKAMHSVWNYTYIKDTAAILKRVTNKLNSNKSNHRVKYLNGISVINNEFIDSREEYDSYRSNQLYHATYDDFVDSNQSSSYFMLQGDFDPYGRRAKPFVSYIRHLLSRYCTERYTKSHTDYDCYLYSDSVGTVDSIKKIYDSFPYMFLASMVLCFVVSAFVFNSKWTPLRLVLTIMLPLVAVFGLAVAVYQKGFLSRTGGHALDNTHGIAYIIPLLTCSLMLGLALDYDMYISERIREHMRKGDALRIAIVKAVYESGTVVTSAALIIAAAFVPLLFAKTEALNQAGFIVICSLLFDAFVVRPMFAPALMTLADSKNWVIDPCFRRFCLDEDRRERWRMLVWHPSDESLHQDSADQTPLISASRL